MKFSELKKDKKWKLPQFYPKLTQPERAEVRSQYVKEQEGLCYHCKEPLSGPPAQEILERFIINLARFPKGFLSHPFICIITIRQVSQ